MQESKTFAEKLFVAFRGELKHLFRSAPAFEKLIRRLLRYFPALAVFYTRIAIHVFHKPAPLKVRVLSPRALVILDDLNRSIAKSKQERPL
jgi:hypothetical protein